MASRILLHWLLLIIYAFLVAVPTFSSDDPDESAVLLKFKDSMENAGVLDTWNKSNALCNTSATSWKGVVCKDDNVAILQLQGLGLGGALDVEPLARLSNLCQLSLMNNNFTGAMPDVKKLIGLRALYLANNRFSGDIPEDAFAGMNGIRRVVLANNNFTGRIPTSLTQLEKLVDLQLQNNGFMGNIPNFPQIGLKVNLANNGLEGPIPKELGITQIPSSFKGNMNVCGPPLEPCKSSKHSILSKTTILLSIIAAALLIVFAIILGSFACFRRSRAIQFKHENSNVNNLYKQSAARKPDDMEKDDELKNKNEVRNLHFVRDDYTKFQLDDLLRASAEVLGSGNLGSSYKAKLNSVQEVVVKRFKHMSNVGKEEFFEHMRKMGKLSHPNVLLRIINGSIVLMCPMLKEEKLVVAYYAPSGSLATHLHSKRGPKQSGLDWPTRLKIVKGVARGLDYLHTQLSHLILPHGNLKSSNVLLDSKFEPLLADYALAPVTNKQETQQFMTAYKSPEVMQHGQVTKQTDVWSLGILILELLTGRFPANYLKEGKGENDQDLAVWVKSVVSEEWTGEVFDKEMNGTSRGEGQMLKLLKIGMCCCEWSVEKRWDLKEAVERIEELNDRDSEDDYSSLYGSEGELYSSKAITDDDFSFSMAERSTRE